MRVRFASDKNRFRGCTLVRTTCSKHSLYLYSLQFCMRARCADADWTRWNHFPFCVMHFYLLLITLWQMRIRISTKSESNVVFLFRSFCFSPPLRRVLRAHSTEHVCLCAWIQRHSRISSVSKDFCPWLVAWPVFARARWDCLKMQQ